MDTSNNSKVDSSSSRKGRNGKKARLVNNRWDASNSMDTSSISKDILYSRVDSSSIRKGRSGKEAILNQASQ